MPKLEKLLDKVGYPLLVGLLMPIVVTIGSQWATGDYGIWFAQVPYIGRVGFVLFIGLWLGVVLIRKRLKGIEPSGIRTFTASRWGYEDIWNINYGGVKWRAKAPLPSPHSLQRGPDLTPSRIRIRTRPRCPECETELEESRSFWWGYIWKCVGCGWRKRSKDNFSRVEERVEKIAQRKMEKKLSEYQEL